uniref:RING-type domain-containing protein n=1 Tax=Macrostomum lignano TaxID=282301 RepID=A0A1I8FHW4_9PLAT
AIRAASAMASSSNSSSDTPQPPPATATRPLRLLLPASASVACPTENGSAAASAAGGRQRQGRGPRSSKPSRRASKDETRWSRGPGTSAAAFRRAVDATPLPPARRQTLISRPTLPGCRRGRHSAVVSVGKRRPWRPDPASAYKRGPVECAPKKPRPDQRTTPLAVQIVRRLRSAAASAAATAAADDATPAEAGRAVQCARLTKLYMGLQEVCFEELRGAALRHPNAVPLKPPLNSSKQSAAAGASVPQPPPPPQMQQQNSQDHSRDRSRDFSIRNQSRDQFADQASQQHWSTAWLLANREEASRSALGQGSPDPVRWPSLRTEFAVMYAGAERVLGEESSSGSLNGRFVNSAMPRLKRLRRPGAAAAAASINEHRQPSSSAAAAAAAAIHRIRTSRTPMRAAQAAAQLIGGSNRLPSTPRRPSRSCTRCFADAAPPRYASRDGSPCWLMKMRLLASRKASRHLCRSSSSLQPAFEIFCDQSPGSQQQSKQHSQRSNKKGLARRCAGSAAEQKPQPPADQNYEVCRLPLAANLFGSGGETSVIEFHALFAEHADYIRNPI